MKSLITRFGALTLLVCTAAARAQTVPIMDGTADALYGTALSVQNTLTRFGDNDSPDPIASNSGSEIDQIFARVSGGRLYVLIAGNLEPNFNKMEVYVDSVAGGVNTITGASLPTQVDGYCCTQGGGVNLPSLTDGALQRQNGLTLDAGFNADYYLTFSNGREEVGPTGTPDRVGFWAITAHYAELGEGTAGSVVPAGMQLAHRGKPNVLRGPLGPDFDSNFNVDGNDFLTWQRGVGRFDGTTTQADKSDGDANDDNLVDATDLAQWKSRYASDRLLTDFPFYPFEGGPSSDSLLGPALPGLGQGQLIDKNYVAAHPGTGARELAFVTAVDPSDPNNALNHRNMENTIGLEMAFDSSNIQGVSGTPNDTDPMTLMVDDDPQNVRTGLEFSIPLSQIGSPTGGISLMVFVNNNGHNFASNQFGGVGIDDGNLGGNGFGGFTGDLAGVDMTDFAGNQFVTVTQGPAVASAGSVPEPAANVLVTLAGIALGCHRRARQASASNG